MATSALRLAANRANARKSTGPRTEAGKRASSQNARKTPPCPFTFQLPPHFAEEAFHDALCRTAPCPDDRARLLLINRCLLQAHEIRWHALEDTLFETAHEETGGNPEEETLWIAQQPAYVKGLLAYHRWITRRINQVERGLAILAAQAARGEKAAPKAMAAGAGSGSTCPAVEFSDLGPEGLLPIAHTGAGWAYGPFVERYPTRSAAPELPRPPRSSEPSEDRPLRVRNRLYLDCPAPPEPPNEPNTPNPTGAPTGQATPIPSAAETSRNVKTSRDREGAEESESPRQPQTNPERAATVRERGNPKAPASHKRTQNEPRP